MKLELLVTIHDTPAAIRFGGDGYLITFAGTEQDKAEAAKLLLLNKMQLKMTLELYDGNQETEKEDSEADARSKTGRRPWLERKQRAGSTKADG